MLDTIRLRLYGILDTKGDTLSEIQKENGLCNYVAPEHNELYLKILEKRGKNFTMQMIYNREKQAFEPVDEKEWIRRENAQKLTHHWQERHMIRFIDERKQKDINMRINGTYRVPSSFSDVTFNVSENGSFIDFEFSIPKYLFGHSLAEFIPQAGSDLKFDEGIKLVNMDYQSKYLHQRLMKFIDVFFSDLCGFFGVDMLPNLNYVEIRRLDLCYNQYFSTKDDALLYLAEQRKLEMKRQRRNADIQKSYDTSITYHSTNGSYFKIYHKGSEYSKSDGDLKKHMLINQKIIDGLESRMQKKYQEIYTQNKRVIWDKLEAKGKGLPYTIDEKTKERIKGVMDRIYVRLPYKVDFLKQEMDKVLRYEISLRTAFFTGLYKRKIFRTGSKKFKMEGCPHHAQAMRIYREVKNALDDRTRERKITREDRKIYKKMNEWLNRGVCLLLNDSQPLKRFERKSGTDYNETTMQYKISRYEYRHTVLGGRDVGRFSEFFLRKCVDYFREMIEHYQIKTIKPYDEILSKIHAYNEEAEKRVEQFNLMNEHLCFDLRGEPRRKNNGQKIVKASQLLKQSELREMRMKKVNATILGVFVTEIEKGRSLPQIFKDMKTPSSTKSRIKKDLEMFGVFDQSLKTDINVEVRTDFFQYYWNTDSELYRAKFFAEPKHFNYNYGPEQAERAIAESTKTA